MHFKKLDLNLLVALDALIRHQSVSHAAEELHLSQSAMSSSLSRLRDYFQDELLMKIGRKMELTAHAKQLEQPLRDILIKIDASLQLKPNFDPASSEREFRICVSDYTLYTLIPYILRIASIQKSTVKLNFLPQVSDPKKELDKGDADLVIIPDIFCSDEHPCELLHEETYECVVWRDSYLAEGEMTLQKFKAAKHLCMQPPSANPPYETLSFNKAGIKRDVAVRSFSFTCLPSLIIGSDLIATLQSKLIDKAIVHNDDLKRLPTPVPLATLKESMQWHAHRDSDPGVQWLISIVRQGVAQMIQG